MQKEFGVVSIQRIKEFLKDIKVSFHQGLSHLGWIDQDRWGGEGGAGTVGGRGPRRCWKVTPPFTQKRERER